MATQARFYDGTTAAVHAVSVRATAAELVLFRSADATIQARWPIADIVLLGDLGHEAVPPIACRGSDARLIVEDPALRRELAGLVPQLAPLAESPAPAGRRVLGFGATLVALVGLFWLAVDYGSEYAAPLLPYSLQAALGESVFDELVADKDECHGAAGLKALNRLANDLAEAADYHHPITVHVVEGGPVNAFALPGGILVFYSELIDRARDRNQVAGVLAHELGHVVHYHSVKGLGRQYGVDLLVRLVSGGYSDLVSTLATGGNLLLAMRNGRAFERDADKTGIELLEALGLRADGVSSFFEQLMEKEPADRAAAAGIWSSHPPTQERIEATRRPATGKPAFTDAEWRAIRNVCK
ncbi:M48 family metallopeptidase [Reyranella sp.]|uniref:M48 family metallopeptidase n=1 Tax=Reyranella sp. TaxID=1929291 RepID=UPI003BA9A34C